MNFMVFDIGLLVVFALVISIFLYRKRKKVKKEGMMLLYRTKVGMKIIDFVGRKYKKSLKFLSYIAIGMGYFLMAGVFYLVGKIVWVYIFYPNIVRQIKVPPIMPLIPYLPQMFKLDLPPFYFIYWIIIIALIAIPHEFAHGIFMRRFEIKVKSTGFGFFPFFLPVFLAAFVEQDEKSMKKGKIFHQMAVLAAGTFANILVAILSFGIMVLFFSVAFTPSGVIFQDYAYSVVGITAISSINNIYLENPSYEKISELVNETGLTEVKTEDKTYFITKDFLEMQQNNQEYILLYENSPAIHEKIKGAITEVNGIGIKSLEDLSEELEKYSAGEKIEIKTIENKEIKEYNIILRENPENGKAFLGISFPPRIKTNWVNKIINFLGSYKKQNIYYKPNFVGSSFIYNLLWWLVLISISVAFINMLPAGIFDGGRFFYLTILSLTKSEKKAHKAYKFFTFLFIFVVILLMVFWGMSFF